MRIPFDDLGQADLIRHAVYAQGHDGTLAGEPVSHLMHVGNQGGFRPAGGWNVPRVALVVLTSTGAETEWPDHLDETTGVYTYYGDNRTPGRGVEASLVEARGNRLLTSTFAALHSGRRSVVPPFFVFRQVEPGRRDVRFLGLAALGANELDEQEDLVAFWSSSGGPEPRFLNYRAKFTLLDVERVARPWIDRLVSSGLAMDGAPEPWHRFVDRGEYDALRSGAL